MSNRFVYLDLPDTASTREHSFQLKCHIPIGSVHAARPRPPLVLVAGNEANGARIRVIRTVCVPM